MACFLVSAAGAVITDVTRKGIEKKEQSLAKENPSRDVDYRIPVSTKLKWLTNMLWGGVVLLLFEHIWHGEVTPFFPFLTAMSDPSDAAEMLHEMATVGVGMLLLVVAVWLVMCKVADVIAARDPKTQEDNH